MKKVIIAVIFIGLAAVVFGQDAKTSLYQTLDDSIESTLSYSSDRLQNFDRDIMLDGQGKSYSSYKKRYDAISLALRESELRLTRLVEFHETAANIKVERDRYEGFIKQLEQVKSEYDGWFTNVQ